MKFEKALQLFDTILENGPLGTRLKYDYGLEASCDLTDQEKGRKALFELYEGDLAVAQTYHLPMILNAATFRTSRNHLQNPDFRNPQEVVRINIDRVELIKTIRERYVNAHAPIFIGAPLGSMYDAYSIKTIPSVEEAKTYHQEQINIFKALDVDFVNVVTLPSLTEAIGIALAAELADIPYVIGFILNEHAMLFDGTELDKAIETIDAAVIHKPLGYLVTCTHTSIIDKLTQSPSLYSRLIGIQPNGSHLSPQVLACMNKPIADSPEIFAKALMRLKTVFGLKIVSGCCGTTRKHLECIAQMCASS